MISGPKQIQACIDYVGSHATLTLRCMVGLQCWHVGSWLEMSLMAKSLSCMGTLMLDLLSKKRPPDQTLSQTQPNPNNLFEPIQNQ